MMMLTNSPKAKRPKAATTKRSSKNQSALAPVDVTLSDVSALADSNPDTGKIGPTFEQVREVASAGRTDKPAAALLEYEDAARLGKSVTFYIRREMRRGWTASEPEWQEVVGLARRAWRAASAAYDA
jgi:hypothetical protein